MKTIQYRVTFTGVVTFTGGVQADVGVETEVVEVRAQTINSGYTKALMRALEPLGSGGKREIGSIEFWQVV